MYALFSIIFLLISNFFYVYMLLFFLYRLHVATRCILVGFATMSRKRTQWIEKKSQNWYAFFATLVNLFKLLARIAIVNLASTHAWSAIFLMMKIKINIIATDAEYVESAAVTSSFIVPSATCACRFSYKMGIR